MREFHIAIRSSRDVMDFVSLAMRQPFDVLVGNEWQQISGKSFMAMLSLDYKKPLRVRVTCSEEEFSAFRTAASPFLV